MNKPLFYLLPILALLHACVTSDHSSIANSQQVTSALALKAYPEYANVYIRRDDASSGRAAGMNIKINKQSVGKLRNESYFNVKIIPGTYTINIHWEEVNLQTATFSYKFKAGQVILIQCSFGIMLGHEKKKNILSSRPYGAHLEYPCWYETDLSEIKSILKNDSLLTAFQTIYSPVGYFEYTQARQKNTIKDYQTFVADFPASSYTRDAQSNLAQLIENRKKRSWNKLTKQQKCTLQHDGWLYIDKSCRGRVADGEGRAVYSDTRHSFNGIIKNGQFISGKYLLDGQMLYDGHFKNAKPSGKGICLHNGALEECKYYNGERVDSLYKQRLAMAEMEKRQQLELEKIRGEISDLKNQRAQVTNSGMGKDIGDALLDKAIDKGIEKIFDSLF